MTAKQGIVGLTRALAYELGPQGINVNCVSPGLIMAAEDSAKQTERMRAVFRPERVPLARMGDIEELAAAVVALCGPAFGYMSGQVVHVNGGVHLGSPDQNSRHLTESANLPPAGLRAIEAFADHGLERFRVGPSIDHQFTQRLVGHHRDVAVLPARPIELQAR